jgi:hypothetical protein
MYLPGERVKAGPFRLIEKELKFIMGRIDRNGALNQLDLFMRPTH